MNTTKIKAKWAGKLLRSKHFVVITDTEATILAEHTNAANFDDLLSASAQLASLRKFHIALGHAVKDFEVGMNKKFGLEKPKTLGKNAKKITVK